MLSMSTTIGIMKIKSKHIIIKSDSNDLLKTDIPNPFFLDCIAIHIMPPCDNRPEKNIHRQHSNY